MAEPTLTRCPRCKQLEARVAELEAQVARLQKHSGNSSKPPSSDIVKPPPKSAGGRRGKKRRRGGQPGHARHERPAFGPEQVDHVWEYSLSECPDCGGALGNARAAPRVVQQVEIVDKPIRITEHRGLAQWCSSCHKRHDAPLPPEVQQAGLIGARLTALVAYLKGACHCSFSTVHHFLRDVVGVSVSRGQLAKVVQKVSASLREPYDELLAAVPHAARLNVDETGHPDQKRRFWTWCFRARLYTLYKIDPSRGSDVLIEVLGRQFNGLLGCDYFSAYRKYMRECHIAVQFCLAHFIRDVKFLVEHPRPVNRRYGQLLLGHLRTLFGVIHRRAEFASEDSFRRQLAVVRNALVGDAIAHVPDTREAGNLADRFIDHGDSYFRFITEPDVEPTNNLAEQAIRFVAIHRRITQGTRGDKGQRWCERLWTAVTTCAQQGRSVFSYLYQAVQAWFVGRPAPTLLPDTS